MFRSTSCGRCFATRRFTLIQHHVDSYNDMLDARIPTFLRASNPFELELPDKRYVRDLDWWKEARSWNRSHRLTRWETQSFPTPAASITRPTQ
jgi:hypothetical protein